MQVQDDRVTCNRLSLHNLNASSAYEFTENMDADFARRLAEVHHPLGQDMGYGIVVGLGLAFSVVMGVITWISRKYLSESSTSSETYMCADREVRTGLVSSAVVSSWTWAATLLQSSAVAYAHGVSGPFWYARNSRSLFHNISQFVSL